MTISSVTRNLGTGVAASPLLLCAQAQAITNPGTITGVVKNQAGQPVVGAFVRLKNADKRLSFMVVSQPGGTYTAGDLPAGQYTIQAIGGANQSPVSAPVSVAQNGSAKMDVALTASRGPLLTPSWPGRVPETEVAKVSTDAKDLPAGDGKALVAEKCTVCHD